MFSCERSGARSFRSHHESIAAHGLSSTILGAMALLSLVFGSVSEARAAGRCGLTLSSVKHYDPGGAPLKVREGPGTGYGIMGTVDHNATGVIISGPTLSEGYYWWYIQWDRSDCLAGYSAEGESDGSECWLIDFDTASLSSPSSSAQITFPYAFAWSSSAPTNCSAQGAFAVATSSSPGPSDIFIIWPVTGSSYSLTTAKWNDIVASLGTRSTYYWSVGVASDMFHPRASWRSFSVAATTYTVSTSSSPSAGGTTSGSGTYASGDSVTVTATPNSGYSFINWTQNGSQVSSSASYSFTVNGTRSLVANFSQNQVNYSINISSSPPAGGTTSGSGTYTSGSNVTVTATPNSGYSFVKWTDNGTQVSTSSSYTFNISSNRDLVANFSASPSSAIRIRVPWDKAGDRNRDGTTVGMDRYFVPQTYDTHVDLGTTGSGRGYSFAVKAVDFYYASPQSPDVYTQDAGAGLGQNVRAAHSGYVDIKIYENKDYCSAPNSYPGQPSNTLVDLVVTKEDGSVCTRYVHLFIDPDLMRRFLQQEAVFVSQGDIIGVLNQYGCAASPHLHFQVYRGGTPSLAHAVDLSDPSQVLVDGDVVFFGTPRQMGNDTVHGIIYRFASMPRHDAGGSGPDECPDDPFKTESGSCGCGVPDTDSDADGTADCDDTCPNDPNKAAPGNCGCGQPETIDCGQTFTLRVFTTDGAPAPAPVSYESGTTVYVSAPEAPAGYSFNYWSGDASGSSNLITVLMDRDKTIIANYALDAQTSQPVPFCGAGIAESAMLSVLGLTVISLTTRRRTV